VLDRRFHAEHRSEEGVIERLSLVPLWLFYHKTNDLKKAVHYTFLMSLFLVLLTLTFDLAYAQCPSENTRGLEIIEGFLMEEFYAERRDYHEISASVDSIRSLNEEQDLEACNHFSSMLDPGEDEVRYRKLHYYKAGDYYFVLNLVRPRREEWPDPEALLSVPREVGFVFGADLEPILVFFL